MATSRDRPANELSLLSSRRSPEEPLTFLREAYRLLQKERIRILARFDLSLTEYYALRLCAEAPAMLSDVAETAGVTSAGATDIIDRLEQRKLVRRLTHPSDRRARLVALTLTGRRLFSEAQSAQHALLKELGRSMTGAEREGLITGLEALVRSLPSASDRPDAPR